MNDLSVSVAEAKRASVDTGTGCQPFIMPHLALSLPHRMPPGEYQSLKDQTPKKPLWVNCSQSKYSLTLSAVFLSQTLSKVFRSNQRQRKVYFQHWWWCLQDFAIVLMLDDTRFCFVFPVQNFHRFWGLNGSEIAWWLYWFGVSWFWTCSSREHLCILLVACCLPCHPFVAVGLACNCRWLVGLIMRLYGAYLTEKQKGGKRSLLHKVI